MKRVLTVSVVAFLLVLLALPSLAGVLVSQTGGSRPAQNNTSTSSANNNRASTGAERRRGPVFRATKEQIKQAQAILKQRGFYQGELTGKLDTDTRAGLRKYQETEGIKPTATLNRATLEKMNIVLTEKQKAM